MGAVGKETSVDKRAESTIDERLEREETEVHLRQIAAIVESSDDAIIGNTLDGTITSWNPAAERIYGYSADEAIGRSIEMLVPDSLRGDVPGILAHVQAGDRVEQYETGRARKDGTVINVWLTISGVRDASGTIVGTPTIARDINERLRGVEALDQSKDSYRALFEHHPGACRRRPPRCTQRRLRVPHRGGDRDRGTRAQRAEALAQIESMQPAVAIVDVRMPDMSGIEVAREAVRISPSTGVILYTGAADHALLVEAVDAGARAFVLKEAPLTDLVRAIETIADGGTYVDAVLAGTLASGNATGRLVELTKHERETLRLLADGMNYDEIGKELHISPETVRTHVRKAMTKLDSSTRTQAIATALRQALIT
jgi:PAS domain S-box-containing protein